MSTNKRFKITDIDNEYFYQVPKSLLTQKNYRGLSSGAKIIYSILKDRMSLSRKNNWKDENGDIYLMYKQEHMAEILGMSVSTVSRIMKQLEKFSLVEIIRQGLNRPNKIYINKIEVIEDEDDIQDMDCMFGNEENLETTNKSESAVKDDKSRTCKYENPNFLSCKSGLAGEEIRTCRNANQDLREWESRLAPVQPSNNYINQNNNNNNNNNNDQEYVELIKKLCKLGFDQSQALELYRIYGFEQIKAKLNMLKKQKNVKNCIGWLLVSLQNNYVQKPLPPDVSAPTTVDNGHIIFVPLSTESAEYAAACEEAACSIDPESPFYQSFLRIKNNLLA